MSGRHHLIGIAAIIGVAIIPTATKADAEAEPRLLQAQSEGPQLAETEAG